MNILILGTEVIEQKLVDLCLKSKFLDHLYTASEKPLENIPNIEYSDYSELCKKAKLLQIDIILLANKKYIQDELVECLKKNRLNVISVNKKWLNLEDSRIVAKQLIRYYEINTPETIMAPISFPLVIKTKQPHLTKIVYSMQELIEIKENLLGEDVFLEEYLEGEIYYLLSLWDGKSLINFSPNFDFTEVQNDRLDVYKTKLNFLLSDEKADFTGFFTTKLIWSKNDWYVLGFSMHIDEKSDLTLIKSDFLYLLNSAIYQKLDEI